MSRTVIIPLIVACALFMENIDATVIATSLPALARDLGQDPITLKLALTAYVVGLGVFIPVCGWVADRFVFPFARQDEDGNGRVAISGEAEAAVALMDEHLHHIEKSLNLDAEATPEIDLAEALLG